MDFKILTEYILNITPGFLIGLAILKMLPNNLHLPRVFIYIMLFILCRDAMTPLGLWKIDSYNSIVWLRFNSDAYITIFLGIMALVWVLSINKFEPDLKNLLVYFKDSKVKSIVAGIAGGIILYLPIFLIYRNISIENRGGLVNYSMLIVIFILSVLGNFYEEALFRGYFQGYMETLVTPVKAALLSGLLFAFGHMFLAYTVTNTGLPVIIFTLYEGLGAALLRMRYGLVAAALMHGVLIFLLTSGI